MVPKRADEGLLNCCRNSSAAFKPCSKDQRVLPVLWIGTTHTQYALIIAEEQESQGAGDGDVPVECLALDSKEVPLAARNIQFDLARRAFQCFSLRESPGLFHFHDHRRRMRIWSGEGGWTTENDQPGSCEPRPYIIIFPRMTCTAYPCENLNLIVSGP